MNAQTRIRYVSLLAPLLVTACMHQPRPPQLANAEQASRSPASIDAARVVPQAFANAERLRADAEKQYERGHFASASILAERAQVAYERAAVLARIARASTLLEDTRQQLEIEQKEVRQLETEQARLTADVEAIEARVKAAQDAEPIVPSGRADPAREAARMSAVRWILADGRLLCASASLLGTTTGQSELDSALANIQKIEASVQAGTKTVPIDDARRARSRCMAALSAKRRDTGNLSSGAADIVLNEIAAQTSLSPVRDERGVVVTLSPGSDLAKLASVALKYPNYPLLVVGFGERSKKKQSATAKAAPSESVVNDLVRAGIARERIHQEQVEVGSALDVPTRSNAPKVQLVFVSPQT